MAQEEEAKQRTGEAAASTRETAAAAASCTKETAASMAEAAKETAASLAESAKETAESVAQRTKEVRGHLWMASTSSPMQAWALSVPAAGMMLTCRLQQTLVLLCQWVPSVMLRPIMPQAAASAAELAKEAGAKAKAMLEAPLHEAMAKTSGEAQVKADAEVRHSSPDGGHHIAIDQQQTVFMSITPWARWLEKDLNISMQPMAG